MSPAIIFYFIGTCSVILTFLIMFSTYKPKDSGEKCECCGKHLTDEEYFRSMTCGHCLLGIKNLEQSAPEGYKPVRIRQLKKGQYFLYTPISRNDMIVTDISDSINCVRTYPETETGNIRTDNKSIDIHKFGLNNQSWCWLKITGKK